MVERLRINALGRRGDAVARLAGRNIYVPFALPGEVVEIARDGGGAGERAELLAIVERSRERAEPICPVYGRCGGCVAQHLDTSLYAGWKRSAVTEALAAAQIAAPVGTLVDAHGAGRRRVVLHVRFKPEGMVAGFMARRSHDLVAIDTCPITEPALAEAPSIAAALAGALARGGKPLDIQLTATETGLDVDLRGHGTLAAREREALIVAAERLDLARLSLHGEIVVARRSPVVAIGRARVVPPPGGFLQATVAGEAALAREVMAACEGSSRAADLFAGIGPFALRLAKERPVHAVEAEAAALAALSRAAGPTAGLRPVTTEIRDLFRRPLLAAELAPFDAVVIDPPRAGAEAQARQLALSPVPLVVSVSCDPGTFARDARIMIVGGYRLERVTPIDQFKYSPHVEIVGVFRKAVRKSARRRSLR